MKTRLKYLALWWTWLLCVSCAVGMALYILSHMALEFLVMCVAIGISMWLFMETSDARFLYDRDVRRADLARQGMGMATERIRLDPNPVDDGWVGTTVSSSPRTGDSNGPRIFP